MRAWVAGAMAVLAAARPAPAAEDAALAPFVADYEVRYSWLQVGTSQTEVAREGARWSIESRTTATGLARLKLESTLRQRSEFDLTADGPRPVHYLLDDGTKDTSHDVALDFDWSAGRVHGTAEDADVDLESVAGLQDSASMQALVLSRLRAGREPGTIPMIEKDKVKYYRYTFLRRETLKTAIGELETVVYRSARDGSARETITWHAPKLGFVAVQAEQRTGGKRGFQTYIRRFQGDAHLESSSASP